MDTTDFPYILKRKAEAPGLLRQANVLPPKKALFDFIGGRLFDPRSKALQLDKKSGADCSEATSICQADEMAFFSHTVRLAYDLEPQGGGARQAKSGRRPLIGDKHKTSLTERLFFTFLGGLACDLEPMAPAARQTKSGSACSAPTGKCSSHKEVAL
ncbi:hypothetical protein QYG89_08170 [Bacillus sp. B190/17]|uniref:Uncharacterized protein n=1 Tax=Bacillus lumedeiriae TaxID=3058829 RepID=A0ABW8I8Z6_9BACI